VVVIQAEKQVPYQPEVSPRLPVTRIVPPGLSLAPRPLLAERNRYLVRGESWNKSACRKREGKTGCCRDRGMAVVAVSSEQVLAMNKIDYAPLDYARVLVSSSTRRHLTRLGADPASLLPPSPRFLLIAPTCLQVFPIAFV